MNTKPLRRLLAGAVLATACTDDPGTGPGVTTVTITASHTRITTPGRITFTAQSPAPLTRVEIFQGDRKVGQSASAEDPRIVDVVVSSADNGTRTYVAKGYSAGGRVGTSAPVTVNVDIRWDQFRWMEGTPYAAVVWDSTSDVYARTGTPMPDISVLLMRHEADGRRVWTRTFGGTDWESSGSLGVDRSGRAYMAGVITYQPGGGHDCFIVLHDAAGSVVWTRRIVTATDEIECVATTDASGNFYMAAAEATQAIPTTWSLRLAKFDMQGNAVWTREHEQAARPEQLHMAADPLGGIYVSGSTTGPVDGSPNRGLRDAFLAKFDLDGNKHWERQYGTPAADITRDLSPDPDGGVYVVGQVDPIPYFDHPAVDAFVARYAPDGALLWQRRLDGGNRDYAWAVAANQGGVYLLGATAAGATTADVSEPRQGELDVLLAKLSRGGDLNWVRLLGGRGNDTPSTYDLLLGANGDVTVAVQSSELVPGMSDVAIVLARHREVPP